MLVAVAYHTPTFLAEYEAFHQLMSEGRQLEVDPLWLAVLFLVRVSLSQCVYCANKAILTRTVLHQTLANAANAIDYLPPGIDFTYEELTGMFAKYFEDGRAAVDCGDGYGTFARIRTIQVRTNLIVSRSSPQIAEPPLLVRSCRLSSSSVLSLSILETPEESIF
jgi:hypothetical protein